MADPLEIESLSASVIREYLSRKKCHRTLQALDNEMPRDVNSVSNRLKLVQALQIENWMKANKSNGHMFKTMLEVVVHHTILTNQGVTNYSNLTSKEKKSNKHEEHSNRINKPLKCSTSTDSITRHSVDDAPDQLVELVDLDELQLEEKVSKPQTIDMNRQFASKVKTSESVHANDDDMLSSGTSFYRPDTVPHLHSSPYRNQDSEDIYDMNFHIQTKTENASKKKASSVFEMLSASPEKAISARKNQGSKVTFSGRGLKKSADTFHRMINSDKPHVASPYSMRKTKDDFTGSKSVGNEIFEMPDTKKSVNNLVYDFETIKELRSLLFGSVKLSFSSEWLNQNLSFCDCTDGRPDLLRFGIVQQKGGPCGILACVQATVVKHLLFSNQDSMPNVSLLNAADSKRSNCLVDAITEILWRAGGTKAWLAVPTLRSGIVFPPMYRPDGISENIAIKSYSSFEHLRNGVQEHIAFYEKVRGSCILVLYSVILSRGLDAVRGDMDEENGRLIGAHSYCTQEMINLLLVGRASSNAFDKCIKLDGSTILKGVHMQSDIGMLSLFEHYDSCKIGNYYKCPKYPVWIVCSESHFTVLFSLDREVVRENCSSKCFDLFYYDGLANQDEVIRLTVDTVTLLDNAQLMGDLVPPLEHCIRTKWKKASIDWNDTDPIL